MSLVGKEIEPFSAQAYQQGKFITVTDADIKGHWSVIMFYPADFSFVCPTELADLQDQYQTLQQLGVEVYSVSEDTHFVHKAWHDDSDAVGKLQYAMIGDPSHQLARMFDVLDEDQGLAQRGTFILDKNGVVQSLEINADGIGRNASEYIDRIKAGQYVASHPGEVCPAKWKEGAETLTPGLDLVGKI
ncbi:alkyl hydroperoxide reductase subunit C [Lacticaseibacillus pabuli]|uniref:Alkyl hydroperoxide reductase C n=1 Tax=Lacticaseibacillus pabuli TaxID=3025672 RepID=A0ABY7WZD7_9LACO|nr:alkyl hydroperoxide reductase subunit C [Lacticaseibacillus sp. KACC 23028]WDF83275.1 alkyl hydroperoxide reductase subunit C [Lacticaseibacillus sp. KACC 23028]